MKRLANPCYYRLVLCALFSLAILLPAAASATSIALSGNVDSVSGFGNSPFSVSDALSGAFNVDVGADNSFSTGDLNSFNLTIGPAVFALDSSDFGSFQGTLSADGTKLTDFSLVASFVTVPGLDGTFALGFDGVNQPFSVTGTSIATGPFDASVGATPVPEPSSLWLFGFAALGTGLAMRRRRQTD